MLNTFHAVFGYPCSYNALTTTVRAFKRRRKPASLYTRSNATYPTNYAQRHKRFVMRKNLIRKGY